MPVPRGYARLEERARCGQDFLRRRINELAAARGDEFFVGKPEGSEVTKTRLSALHMSAEEREAIIKEIMEDPSLTKKWLSGQPGRKRPRPPVELVSESFARVAIFHEPYLGELSPVVPEVAPFKKAKTESVTPHISGSDKPRIPKLKFIQRDPVHEGQPWRSAGLHQYIKVMKIGVGAYGEVWLAEDLCRPKDVAASSREIPVPVTQPSLARAMSR